MWLSTDVGEAQLTPDILGGVLIADVQKHTQRETERESTSPWGVKLSW